MEVESQEPFQGEVAFADPGMGPVQPAVQGEDEADRMLGHSVGGVGRHAAHRDAQGSRSIQVHVVETGGPQRYQSRAACGKDAEHASVKLIVHEGADRGGPRAEACRLRRQPSLQEQQLVAVAHVGGDQELTVVGLRAEDGDSHCDLICKTHLWGSIPRESRLS